MYTLDKTSLEISNLQVLNSLHQIHYIAYIIFETVKFSANFASILSVMTHNSYVNFRSEKSPLKYGISGF